MSTKKLGLIVIATGLIIFFVSLVGKSILIGKLSIGPFQLLGAQLGGIVFLVGLALFRNKQPQINTKNIKVDFLIEKLLDLPVAFWVFLSFVVIYAYFFLKPMFLNPTLHIQYIYDYIPTFSNVGVDLKAALWFDERWLILHQSPYDSLDIAYTPFFFILYAPLLLLRYPWSYGIFICILLILFTIANLFVPWLYGKKSVFPLFLFVIGLFSYGLQFELERGNSNIIAVSLAIIAVYIYHFHNDQRYWAYLLFILSVQIKIFPAIYILMFVKNWRDWKNNIRRIAGLLLANFLLFFSLGYKIFMDFLKALTVWGGEHFPKRYNNSIQGFVRNLASDGFGKLGPDIFASHIKIIELSLLALFGACLLAVLLSLYIQNDTRLNPSLLLICTVGAIVIPSVSYDYKLPILIAPFALFLSDISFSGTRLKKTASIALLFVTSITYWYLQYPSIVKPKSLALNNAPVLLIMVLSVTVLNFLAPRVSDEQVIDNQAKS